METKITNTLVKTIVLFAVLGIIFLLTVYNGKLLHTLNWYKTDYKFIDNIIIIIAAVAYSLGSIAVVIWYNPTKRENENDLNFKYRYNGAIFLKVIFVIIDGLHVYIYNNSHIEDHATWLSPVYAIQTALIMFFIGAILNDIIKKGREKEEQAIEEENEFKTKISEKAIQINSLKTQITSLQTDIENYKSEISSKDSIILDTNSKLQDNQSDLSDLHSEIEEKDKEISKLQTYYFAYLKSEAARIRKKKPENRTQSERKILEEVN
jgi:flagellar biosynthesis chaperone FliJ